MLCLREISESGEIDHICISRKWRRSLFDVRNKRSTHIASDHHLLIGEIRLRIARIQRQAETLERRFNTRRLEDLAVKRSLIQEIETGATDIPEGGSVEEQWMANKDPFIETSENNLSELRNQRKEWIADTTWRKIKERREAKAAIERARTSVAKYESCQRY
ncbi:uncharacterized protein LOC134210177 [Armigeres subalbatus]|uniref:uncharacterized protein LOC134210177 n=1 Tax=Armigeres subalbatus TaxID=124917 RepID=UPI002ED21E40